VVDEVYAPLVAEAHTEEVLHARALADRLAGIDPGDLPRRGEEVELPGGVRRRHGLILSRAPAAVNGPGA
jgi:hypothetical protein